MRSEEDTIGSVCSNRMFLPVKVATQESAGIPSINEQVRFPGRMRTRTKASNTEVKRSRLGRTELDADVVAASGSPVRRDAAMVTFFTGFPARGVPGYTLGSL